jgi:NADPH2 dehydrogenase
MSYRRLAQLKTAQDFRDYLARLGVDLPFDETVKSGPDSPLAQPYVLSETKTTEGVEPLPQTQGRPSEVVRIGNRFAILPMEGWDGTLDGRSTELTVRRWQRFGRSGAKLICGGEAVAVRTDGRANPHQLLINEANLANLAALREALEAAHEARFGRGDDLLVGLQLTHSGRFARPYDQTRFAPQILYHHPILDRRYGLPSDLPILTDDEIASLVEDFVHAAGLAQRAGFAFVDIKCCHGYLGHEFLSAVDRPGRYGEIGRASCRERV